MGCDANELLRITSDLLYGKLSHIDEARELGEKFKQMFEEKAPYMLKALEKEEGKEYYNDHYDFLRELALKTDIGFGNLLEDVHMIKYTENADLEVLYAILMCEFQISREDAISMLDQMRIMNPNIEEETMAALASSKEQREFEQVAFSYEFPISLAVLTHITRHRMHSLLVPSFVPLWNLDNYVVPNSVAENHEDEYREIFADNKKMVEYFKSQGVRDEDLVYFYLSGNACNVSTTMNARTLMWISKMRSCNKAQWEIRHIVNRMIEEASSVATLIGKYLGSYCKVNGYCPEGNDSCTKRPPVTKPRPKTRVLTEQSQKNG